MTKLDDFSELVRYWLDIFGLHEYRVTLDLTDDETVRGFTEADLSEMIATIYFNPVTNPTEEEIQDVALHEVLELLLHELTETQDPLKQHAETHRVIHRIIHAFRRITNEVSESVSEWPVELLSKYK